MGWIRMDDGFYSHPKFLRAGPRAGYLAICGLAYANQHLTDGFIPRVALRVLHASPKDARALVDAGLWKASDGGWVIHDYAEYQWTREEIERRRSELSAKRAAAGRKGAAARWGANGN